MPYNKGDFTQQGVNGDVSALVRLNEKRIMKVVLSSDDESDNCDISGKVYDLLNGTSYDIGSGGGGGGGVDLRKCTVTVENTSANIGHVMELSLHDDGCLYLNDISIPANGNNTINFMAQYADFLNAYMPYMFWDSFLDLDFEATPTFTNLNNITITEDLTPILTDPTADASFTVRVVFTID